MSLKSMSSFICNTKLKRKVLSFKDKSSNQYITCLVKVKRVVAEAYNTSERFRRYFKINFCIMINFF